MLVAMTVQEQVEQCTATYGPSRVQTKKPRTTVQIWEGCTCIVKDSQVICAFARCPMWIQKSTLCCDYVSNTQH